MIFNVVDADSKRVVFSGVEQAAGLGVLRGIMFKPKEFTTLLFDFGKEGTRENAIHSLFCPDFICVWLNEKREVVWFELADRNSFFIVSPKPFRYLFELPVSKYNLVSLGQTLEW